MIKKIILICWSLFIIACSFTHLNGQTPRNPFESFSILSVQTSYLKTNFVSKGSNGHSMPDSHVYELRIRLARFNSPYVWSDPLFVYLEHLEPDDTRILYDPNLTMIIDGRAFPVYTTEVTIKQKGDFRLTLGILDIYGNIIFDNTHHYCTTTFTIR